MSARRVAALGALLLGLGGLALAIVVAVQEFPRGLIALVCVAVGASAAWYGVVRRGPGRAAGLCVGVLGIGAALVLLVSDRLLEELVVVAALGLSGACARGAFGLRAHLPQAPAPRRAILVFNPKSGAARPSGSRWRPRPGRAGSSRSSSAPRGIWMGSCATRSPAVRTGWRWRRGRLAGHRRRGRRGA